MITFQLLSLLNIALSSTLDFFLWFDFTKHLRGHSNHGDQDDGSPLSLQVLDVVDSS